MVLNAKLLILRLKKITTLQHSQEMAMYKTI